MAKLLKLCIIVLLFSSSIFSANNIDMALKTTNTSSESESSIQKILRYGDYLSDDNDYYRAISEYKRALFYFPEYKKRDWIKLQIGRMYYLGGRYEPAKEYLIPLTASNENNLLFAANNFLALSYYENGEYLNSYRVFYELSNFENTKVDPLDYMVYEALSLARMKRFAEAKKRAEVALNILDENRKKSYGKFFHEAKKLFALGEKLHAKSPGWAILWGTLVPGGGHVYLQQWDNAFISFLLVGGATILAVTGFIDDNLVQATIFTTLASGFYVGSIYSAYSQTKKYNRTYQRIITKPLDRQFQRLSLTIKKKLNF